MSFGQCQARLRPTPQPVRSRPHDNAQEAFVWGRQWGCPNDAGRLRMVLTHRPEFAPDWRGYSHITALALNRLGRGQCSEIVDHLTGGKVLPSEVVSQIV